MYGTLNFGGNTWKGSERPFGKDIGRVNEGEELAVFKNVILGLDNLEEVGIEIVSVFVLGRFNSTCRDEANIIVATEYTQDDIFLIQGKDELFRITKVRHPLLDHFINLHLSAHQVDNASRGDHLSFEILDGVDVLSVMSDSDDTPGHVKIIRPSPSRKATDDL